MPGYWGFCRHREYPPMSASSVTRQGFPPRACRLSEVLLYNLFERKPATNFYEYIDVIYIYIYMVCVGIVNQYIHIYFQLKFLYSHYWKSSLLKYGKFSATLGLGVPWKVHEIPELQLQNSIRRPSEIPKFWPLISQVRKQSFLLWGIFFFYTCCFSYC